jgi:hypothetical protein
MLEYQYIFMPQLDSHLNSMHFVTMAVDDLSIVALIISLVTLFTTLQQLLQQYYATADGYRRCQNPAIAVWATHQRFR